MEVRFFQRCRCPPSVLPRSRAAVPAAAHCTASEPARCEEPHGGRTGLERARRVCESPSSARPSGAAPRWARSLLSPSLRISKSPRCAYIGCGRRAAGLRGVSESLFWRAGMRVFRSAEEVYELNEYALAPSVWAYFTPCAVLTPGVSSLRWKS